MTVTRRPRADPNSSYGGIFKNPNDANQKINLLWIGCGELDFVFERASAVHESLQKHGVRHVSGGRSLRLRTIADSI